MMKTAYACGQIQINKSQKAQLEECLQVKLDRMIFYKDNGQIDEERTRFGLIEDHSIKILSLVSSFQSSTDKRLKESYVQSNVIADIAETKSQTDPDQDPDDENDLRNLQKKKDQKELIERVRSALITPDELTQVEKSLLGDHLIQFFIEPI